MNKKLIISGITFLTIIVLACFPSFANAGTYNYYPYGKVSGNGNVWQFNTIDQYNGATFSGNDVVLIEATYWDSSGIHILVPKNIVLNDNKVQLVFNPQDLPNGALGTSIIGQLSTGETFQVTGPGFTYRIK
jgi:hypothetical protein